MFSSWLGYDCAIKTVADYLPAKIFVPFYFPSRSEVQGIYSAQGSETAGGNVISGSKELIDLMLLLHL